MSPTHISWADDTLNFGPGCEKKSEGCGMPRPGSDDPDDSGLCYAIRQARMRASNPNPKIAAAYAGLVHRNAAGRLDWTGKVNLLPERIDAALRWRKRRRIFVNSMGDTFNDAIPDELIARLFVVAAVRPEHTFILLTKNHARMRALLSSDEFRQLVKTVHSEMQLAGIVTYRPLVINVWPLPNVWVGVSVENQRWADIRIPALLATPAAVRWISAEPLLGPLDLSVIRVRNGTLPVAPLAPHVDQDTGAIVRGIHWIVAGGESGPTARPMHPGWVRSLRDQCEEAGIAFHLKQRGEFTWDAPAGLYVPDAYVREADGMVADEAVALELPGKWQGVWKVGKKASGRELDGRVWDDYPVAA